MANKWETVWISDFGTHKVGPEWNGVRIRKDGWPDQRFLRGKEMVAHFQKIGELVGRKSATP